MRKQKDISVEIEPSTGILYVNGDPYINKKAELEKIDGVQHIKRIILRKASKKEIDDIFNKVVNALKSKIKKEDLIREALKDNATTKELIALGKEIDKKKPIKVHHGCLGVKVGKKYVQLFG